MAMIHQADLVIQTTAEFNTNVCTVFADSRVIQNMAVFNTISVFNQLNPQITSSFQFWRARPRFFVSQKVLDLLGEIHSAIVVLPCRFPSVVVGGWIPGFVRRCFTLHREILELVVAFCACFLRFRGCHFLYFYWIDF